MSGLEDELSELNKKFELMMRRLDYLEAMLTESRQYPELVLPPDHRQNWIDDRRGSIVGIQLAEKFDFEVGDTVPLIGTIYPRTDRQEWMFNVHGIYRSTRANVDEMT